MLNEKKKDWGGRARGREEREEYTIKYNIFINRMYHAEWNIKRTTCDTKLLNNDMFRK